MTRDDSGRFGPGNKFGKGRPVGSGKAYAKDIIWEKLNRLVDLVFAMPDDEFTRWVEMNKGSLSRAEMIFLKRINEEGEQSDAVKDLMDRYLPKTLKVEGEMIHRNPVIERLYDMTPSALRDELEQMDRDREIIEAEYKSIEAVKRESGASPSDGSAVGLAGGLDSRDDSVRSNDHGSVPTEGQHKHGGGN